MDKKKIATLALVGALSLGGTVTAFATTANAASQNSPKAITEEQATEAETQDENVVLPAGGIDQNTAEQNAKASIPGGVIVESELEDENGVIVYGIEIQSGSNTYDVKVDANTGSIVKTDQGNDKDEIDNSEKGSTAGDNDNIEHENDSEDSDEYED